MPTRRRKTPARRAQATEEEVDTLAEGLGDVSLGADASTASTAQGVASASGEWKAAPPTPPAVPVAEPVRTGEGFHKFSRGKPTTFYNPNEGKDLVFSLPEDLTDDEVSGDIRYIARLLSYIAAGVPVSILSCRLDLFSRFGEVGGVLMEAIKSAGSVTPQVITTTASVGASVCTTVGYGLKSLITYLLSDIYSVGKLTVSHLSTITVAIFLFYMLTPQGFKTTVSEIIEQVATVTQCGATCVGRLSEQSKVLIQSLNDLKQGSANKIRRLILRLSEYQNSKIKPVEDKIYEYLLSSGKSKEIVEVFRKYKLIIKRKQEQRALDRDAARAEDLSDVFTGLSVSGGRKSRRHRKKGKAHKTRKHHKRAHKAHKKAHKAHKRVKHATRKPHKARKAKHATRSSPKKVARHGHR